MEFLFFFKESVKLWLLNITKQLYLIIFLLENNRVLALI